jgi:hypothetical protein
MRRVGRVRGACGAMGVVGLREERVGGLGHGGEAQRF